MAGARRIVQDQGGLNRPMTGGDIEVYDALPKIDATNADLTLTISDIARGVISFSSFSAARNVTTPTAAAIIAAVPNLNIGESICVDLAVSVAFAGTFVAGAGVTLKGKAAIPASGRVTVYIVKTSATTVDWIAI